MDTLKILVVDDEARMRKLVKDFLTNKGFAVNRGRRRRGGSGRILCAKRTLHWFFWM